VKGAVKSFPGTVERASINLQEPRLGTRPYIWRRGTAMAPPVEALVAARASASEVNKAGVSPLYLASDQQVGACC
jgi:hypothetical protein